MYPPKIINPYVEGEPFARIPRNAMAAIDILLTDRERRLLLYYAAHQSGFSPAAKLVELHTGITPKHLSSAREGLIDKGFISYEKGSKDCQGRIEILWRQILDKSKALMGSGLIAQQSKELGGQAYPRSRNKQPYTQKIYSSVGGIIDIYPDTVVKPDKSIRELFQESQLNAFSVGKEPQPVFEGYYEYRLDQLEELTESQLEDWQDNNYEELPF